MMTRDSVPRALTVAGLTAFFCSAMVAAAVSLLRPYQQDQGLLERNRAIVAAAGDINAARGSPAEVFAAFRRLDARVVELQSGGWVDVADAHAFDHWMPATLADDVDKPEAGEHVPVYLSRRNGQLHRVVLPVHGAGMWSTIYAYVALEPDLVSIADIVVHDHAETPGVGDRIENPDWLASWRGKRLYGENGELRFRVARPPDPVYGVDLISGASVTADALGLAVRQWFGEAGYPRFLARLREQEAGS